MAALDANLSVSQPLPSLDSDFDLANAALAGAKTPSPAATRLSREERSKTAAESGTETLEPNTADRREAGRVAYRLKLEELGERAAMKPIYLDALKNAATIPTVSFSMRASPRPRELMPIKYQGRGAGADGFDGRAETAPSQVHRETILMRDPSLPPSPQGLIGSRHGLKQFKLQRRKEGRVANETPGRNELKVPPALREDYPQVAEAADIFNVRHRVRTRTTTALLTGITHDPTSLRMYETFDTGLDEVRRNRLFLRNPSFGVRSSSPAMGVSEDEKERQRKAAKRRNLRRPAAKWQVDTSVFLPRKLRGNSRDYYETDEAIERTLSADLRLALMARKGFIQKLIVMHDDGGEGVDEDGNGVEDEVEDVEAVLRSHARLIYNVFDYYSCIDTAATNSTGIDREQDIYDMALSGLLTMVRDCRLASAECPARVFELIFSQVDAKDEATLTLDKFNRKNHLDRQEFIQVLVRIALERYVKTKEILDVSDALETLCRTIDERLPEPARQDSNLFRERYCYLRQVDMVLRKHLKTLKSLFTRYADLSEGQGDAIQEALDSAEMMSIREWMAMISHLGFFESGQLSYYEAKQIFTWARIRGIRDNSQASLIKLRNLYFEDFMEAIIRLSMVVALPTDEDLSELGVTDAGEYLISLAKDSPSFYREYVKTRKGSWFGPPKQPIWRCIDHLILYCERLIEANSRGDKDLTVSEQEVRQFARSRTKGVELILESGTSLSAQGTAVLGKAPPLRKGKSHAAAMRAVAERHLSSLRGSKHLADWEDGKLKKLLTIMSSADFEEGEMIFHQGDPSDKLYLISSGTAEALRTEPGAEEETQIATFGQGDLFGERELVSNEVRFASVKAVTALKTLCITREGYERAFGNLKGAFGQNGSSSGAEAAPPAASEEGGEVPKGDI